MCTPTLNARVFLTLLQHMASIGDEIKQKQFNSPFNKLLINVLFTASWLEGCQNQIFKRYDLTLQQFNILRILRGQHPEPASVSLLRDRMIDKMSNVSRIVDKLKAKGLVTRRTCRNDRRQVDLKITDTGLALLAEIDTELQQWESRNHGITPAEAQTTSDLLDRWRG